MEIEQKGVKWVDASGMAVRVPAEKAASAEEEQQWQVLVEAVGRKSGRLEPGSGRKPWRKRAKCLIQGRERAVKRGESVEKCRSPGRAGGTKEKTDMGG